MALELRVQPRLARESRSAGRLRQAQPARLAASRGLTRRLVSWLTAASALVLFVVLGVLDGRLRQTGGPGILPFEFAGDLPRAREILADWGAAGRDTARLSLWLDFAFLAAYGAFLALVAAALHDLAVRRG